MKDFDHLMSVWQAQPKKEHLSVDEVLKQVKKGIRGITSRLYWAIIAMIGTTFAAFILMFFMAFKSPATIIGILIMVVTMMMYLFMILRHYHILNKDDPTQNPTTYLNSLKKYQKDRSRVIGWFYYIYILLLSAGLGLYFIEVLENAPMFFKILTYGSTLVWFMFTTFYIKPRMLKSEEEKLNLLIDRLERLQQQFD
jgi:DMSO reductase anchor subunit